MSQLFSADAEERNILTESLVPYSISRNIRSAYPRDAQWKSWPDIVAMLREFSEQPFRDKQAAPLISSTIFSDGHRCNASATETGMALLDTDGGTITIDNMVDFLRDYQFETIVYSSARNRPQEPRWRLVIPITHIVAATHDLPRTIYRALAGMMELAEDQVWKIDDSKFAPSSIFYMPGTYQTAFSDDGDRFEPHNRFHHIRGEILPFETWTAIADKLSPLPPPPKHERIERPDALYEDIESAVAVADNDLDYLPWKCVGAAIMNGGGDFPLFDEFSRKYSKYDRLGTERAWSELTRSPMHAVSIGTLFDLAKKSDPFWVSPSRKRAYEGEYSSDKLLSPRIKSDGAPWWQWDFDTDVEAAPADYVAALERDENMCREPDTTPNEETQAATPHATKNDPVDLFGTFTPEPVLTPDMLPKAIRDFAWDTADRMGITPATVAIAALAVSAAAIDDQIVIQHTEDWTWTESARIWCKAVGDPGVTHTAALNAAAAPLEQIEREWTEQDDEARIAYSRQMDAHKVAMKHWERSRTTYLNTGGEDPGASPDEPEEPPMRRLVATDYTMESLQEILADNPRGILLKIDELAAFTGGFDAYRNGKTGKDRPNALKLWDGGTLPVDRVGRHGKVPNWSACIVGKVQENKLASMAAGLTDDGLMQRFLVYQIGTVSMGSHRQPDRQAIDAYAMMIRFLVNQTFSGQPITLSAEAEPYRERIERTTFALKSLPFLSPAFRAHAAKLHGQFARLLLVMHLADQYGQHGYMLSDNRLVVSEATARRCYDLMSRFLIPNSIRIYSRYFDEHDASGTDIRWIADHILAHHAERLTARDLYRAKPEFDKDRKRLDRAVDGMVDANWLTVAPGRQANSVSLVVNPVVHEKYAERAEQERERRAAIRETIANQREVVVDMYQMQS